MAPDIFPILFTDLDGSLLDHYSYSWAPAEAILGDLKRRGVPVIPTTSKTAAELVALRRDIGLDSPFIVENGAAVYLPKDQTIVTGEGLLAKLTEKGEFFVHSLARPRTYWLELLEDFSNIHPNCFEGFASMSPERLMELTSLDHKSAEKALNREYGEPLHWLGSQKDKALLADAVKAQGGRLLQGGRFLHIGDQVDKGMALGWLADCYENIEPKKKIVTVALGDGENDIDMLEISDHAVVIRSPVHEPPILKREENCIVTKNYGPGGWAEAVQKLLERGFTR